MIDDPLPLRILELRAQIAELSAPSTSFSAPASTTLHHAC
jgi:hypothetical protein